MNLKKVDSAKQLREWLDENDLLMNMSLGEAKVMLQTFDEHGYYIGITPDGLTRQSKHGPVDMEVWTIDELIDMACEYNYEDAERLKEKVDSEPFGQKAKPFMALQKIKVNEMILSKAFDKTIYGKEVYRSGQQLAAPFKTQDYQLERRC